MLFLSPSSIQGCRFAIVHQHLTIISRELSYQSFRTHRPYSMCQWFDSQMIHIDSFSDEPPQKREQSRTESNNAASTHRINERTVFVLGLKQKDNKNNMYCNKQTRKTQHTRAQHSGGFQNPYFGFLEEHKTQNRRHSGEIYLTGTGEIQREAAYLKYCIHIKTNVEVPNKGSIQFQLQAPTSNHVSSSFRGGTSSVT